MIGIFGWPYKNMWNQRTDTHAVTYDRVVQFFLIKRPQDQSVLENNEIKIAMSINVSMSINIFPPLIQSNQLDQIMELR